MEHAVSRVDLERRYARVSAIHQSLNMEEDHAMSQKRQTTDTAGKRFAPRQVCLFLCSFVHLFISFFLCLFLYLFIYLSVCLSAGEPNKK